MSYWRGQSISLGRSLQDLIAFLSEIHAAVVDLDRHVQGLDTTALGGGWWNREDRDPPKKYPFFKLTN